ncbi:MAG: uroporphyrinogen-III synthase [Acidobacteriota bacterium]
MSKKILVIRKFDDFSRILAENDFAIINLPLIETSAINDLSDFDAKLANIEIYDGIFITSKNAARILAEKLREKNIKFDGKVYILGNSSFEILRNESLNLVFDESANTAREMLEKIAPDELKNKLFLFVRGEKSLRIVPEFLAAKEAKVDGITVYETRKIMIETDKINFFREEIKKNNIAAACFFSPSGAASFIEHFGAEISHQTIIATIGKTTAEYFETRNLNVGFVSAKSSAEDFAFELIEYLQKEN